MLLAFLLICLSLVQACIAPAVYDATSSLTSSILDTSFSFASSDSIADTCKDIDKCRSLVGIITSCLATIFACIWVAVHPNIPGPNQSWASRQFESFKVIVVTLLVPEWVLAWAVRQLLQSREYAKMLEAARLTGNDEAPLQHKRNSTDEGHTTRRPPNNQGSEQPAGIRLEELSRPRAHWSTYSMGSVSEVSRGEPDNERTRLAPRQSLERSPSVPPEPWSKFVDPWEVEHYLGRTNESWTTAHGFLAIMGGFYYYQNGKPMFPLQVDEVSGLDNLQGDQSQYILALVKSRSFVPPTSDELGDKSKGDTLSKIIAVLQTLWFVAQCIARRIGNLAITNLEIMTLAYTVITVAMYAAWWHKPLNVRCPIRVKGNENIVKNVQPFKWTSRNIIYYVIGEQDYIFRLSCEERVPTFWSSCNSFHGNLPLYADIIALTVAMVFGAVHCAAWSYVFPSLAEQCMWRVCAIAITAIPLPMAVAFAVSDPFSATPAHAAVFFMALGALLYISARGILVVLSFTTLRHLEPSAFQTVQWTTWIPHI
ncbi:hypothetical protein FIBSPDRAFT_937359 [Athelia psychrophila]|uniref:TRP C-terminal domain-containing protein n=1 Tax=Athelia psychrophila TaxID=1759441 RepID=A0A166AMH9_9AGAM|nr:hypothetical protein FIBSPDRAFT_937359 [Fibularhizoctonia sp. CBS 109695]